MWKSTNKQTNNQSNGSDPNKTPILGMTSAISTEQPQPLELQKTADLEQSLKQSDVFESDEDLNHRQVVLANLYALVTQWIMQLSMARRMSKTAVTNVGGTLYTFGSYRLGVHNKGADIDAICVAPRHVRRSDFFTSFYQLLEQRPDVTQLRAIEQAYVPVIKMNFDGIEIDMLFARLLCTEIPVTMDFKDDRLLKNLDPHCVRSLNGWRVTEDILSLVPKHDTFRLTLRAIKLWAKKHGLYNNALGYLGGVSWAMLVARTCQLYPNATSSTLVNKFFLIFSQWEWPRPILLKPPSTASGELPVWDPKINSRDRLHLMPIITPSYPQQNSTFNVTLSTRTIMVEAFKNGLSVTHDIMLGKATWDQLFERPAFFTRYKHFVVLLVSADNPDDHREWCGFVECKIRFLIANLESHHFINIAHVNTERFSHRDSGQDNARITSLWFIGLEFSKLEKLNINLTNHLKEFVQTVIEHSVSINLYKPSMSIDGKHSTRRELSLYVPSSVLKTERKLEAVKRQRVKDKGYSISNKRARLTGEGSQSVKDANNAT